MNVGLSRNHAGTHETPLVAVPVFADEGARGAAFDAVNAAANGRIAAIADEEQFDGKPGKTLLIHTGDVPFKRCLLVGSGKVEEFDAAQLRAFAARAVEAGHACKLSRVSVALPDGTDARGLFFAALGAQLAGYKYTTFLSKDEDPPTVTDADLLTPEVAGEADVLVRAGRAADGVALARDLVNGPPQTVTPHVLAKTAKAIAKDEGLELTLLKKKEIRARGMNLLMAVAAGSSKPPRLIHLTYRPEGATDDTPSVALVGKGITYDAGGYNLKPTGALEDMKIDMAGAAAVLGAMKAVRSVAPSYVVHGIVPTCENLVSGDAYKPGDVYTGLAGKSVEIMNTDAEGRLILADALAYADGLGVDRIVDLATLTGACMVALGPHTAGLFSNDDGFGEAVASAAERAGEDVWPMPLTKKLKKMLKSPIADMKNIGERWGGAITAGLFLSEFVGETTWAHLDIAGPAHTTKAEPSTPVGGTGFGVLTLLELVNGEV